MTAHNGLAGLENTGVSGFHAVDPPGFVPHGFAGIAPIGNGDIFHLVAGNADRRAGNPAVGKNVVVGFVIIHHCRKDSLYVRIVQNCPTYILSIRIDIPDVGSGQLTQGVYGAVGMVVRLQIASPMPIVQEIKRQIFMIAPDENHPILFQKFQNKCLELGCLRASVV